MQLHVYAYSWPLCDGCREALLGVQQQVGTVPWGLVDKVGIVFMIHLSLCLTWGQVALAPTCWAALWELPLLLSSRRCALYSIVLAVHLLA